MSKKIEMDEVKIEKDEFKDIYELSTEIGRGKFAVVKECRHKQKDTWYAAKVIRKRRKGVDCRSEILQEVSMLRVTLSHPHFVDIIEVYETRSEMIIITELMRGGELFKHITTEGQLEEGYTQSIMRQVLSGLAFLHSQEIAHLDIKPQNILLSSESLDCKVKLCDLGLARNVNHQDLFDIIGTIDYLAPEILDYQKLSVACDMWSTGVLVYVMLSGYSPFSGESKQETYLNISQVNLDFPDNIFSTISHTAIDFMEKLLVKDPSSRLKVEESLNHAWLVRSCPSSPNEHEPVKRIRFEEKLSNITALENNQNDSHISQEKEFNSETINVCNSPIIVTAAKEISTKETVKIRSTLSEKEIDNSIINSTKYTENMSKNQEISKTYKSSFIFTSSAIENTSICPTTSKTSPRTPIKSFGCTNQPFPKCSPTISPKHISKEKSILTDVSSDRISPKAQSSELTPHFSRTTFWKDQEPSGISV